MKHASSDAVNMPAEQLLHLGEQLQSQVIGNADGDELHMPANQSVLLLTCRYGLLVYVLQLGSDALCRCACFARQAKGVKCKRHITKAVLCHMQDDDFSVFVATQTGHAAILAHAQ